MERRLELKSSFWVSPRREEKVNLHHWERIHPAFDGHGLLPAWLVGIEGGRRGG